MSREGAGPGSADHRARIVAVVELYEAAADRVACGDAAPGAALFSLGGLMGLDLDLRQVAADRLDTRGWSDPVTAEEYVVSLLAAAALLRGRLDDGTWVDLR